MKLSSRSEYGLRAMVELAQAFGSGPLALADIARAQGLSEGYLEQIIAPLRRAGLVLAGVGIEFGPVRVMANNEARFAWHRAQLSFFPETISSHQLR
ncbi:MAG: Rrf2 family transcriptional regulator [Chloroflexota bacterium]